MKKANLTQSQMDAIVDLNCKGVNDKAIARHLGVPYLRVWRFRKNNGVKAVEKSNMFVPTYEQLSELDHCSNNEMSRRYGINPQTWANVRKRYDIKPFRPPTVIDGRPNTWAEDKPARDLSLLRSLPKSSRLGPSRDYSLAGEAASFLQRERFHVFNREKIGMGEGWQVGNSVLDTDAMIAKAKRMGFEQKEWMG